MMSRVGSIPKEEIQPQRLELSLNPEDGSLLTAPLTQVLLTATDGLYQDIYQMAHGEVDVDAVAADAEEKADERKKRAALSDLAFPQRRHEIAWRLAQHGRGLQHVAALTAAAAVGGLSEQVRVSSTALQYSRTAWVQADEAQDALYFFHAKLFPIRAAPHDIYGAADVHLTGRWLDLPTDLRLAVDPYETSRPAQWTKAQVQEEWDLAIRDKLITGEVGWMRAQQITPPWRVAIRGSRVQLTYGRPRQIKNAEKTIDTYPLSAWLTVLPIEQVEGEPDKDDVSEWILLSLDVTVQAKTGEFNHQLETSNRQRFDLHRLANQAMSKEEKRARQRAQEDDTSEPARPLDTLFRMSHIFLLSWQLELLSAQAQALRRGIWAAGDANPLEITPIQFLDNQSHPEGLLGVLSISFWKVDDSYGPPTLCDLVSADDETTAVATMTEAESKAASTKLRAHIPTSKQLILCIRAEMDRGIRVSVSGASALQAPDTPEHSQRAVRDLLEATSIPLALSANDALLAATRLCAEQKCQATVRAVQKDLPSWIELNLERGGIVVAADIQYHGIHAPPSSAEKPRRPVLFRLACDARTGSFVVLFSRCTHLLRRLGGNELQASEAMAVRVAKLPSKRHSSARADSSGRFVRDAFESLTRSMNVLGQRVGVGGWWDDLDEMSPSLRERNIALACRDVRQSLINACGVAALYGISPLAVSAAFGIEAIPDIAGNALTEKVNDIALLNAPPIGIPLEKKLMETSISSTDGVSKKKSFFGLSILTLSCAATETSATLVPALVKVNLDSPGAVVKREETVLIPFADSATSHGEPNLKKPRMAESDEDDATTLLAVDYFADILTATRDTI